MRQRLLALLAVTVSILFLTALTACTARGSQELTRSKAQELIKANPEFQIKYEIPVKAGEFCRGTSDNVPEPVQFLPPNAGGLEVSNPVIYGLVELDWRPVERLDIRAGTAPEPCLKYYKELLARGIGGEFTFHAGRHFYWKVTVTAKGRAVGLTDNGGVATIATKEILQVTGLAKNGDGTTLVEFRVFWVLTPQAKAAGFSPFGVGEGSPASASFRLYDDGWRVVPGTMKVS